MRSNANVEEKMTKTMTLLGLANVIMSPLLIIDPRVGLVAMLAVNGLLMVNLHEIGRSRRPGSNAIVAVNSIFADRASREVTEADNAIRNIINGGAAVHDELALRLRR